MNCLHCVILVSAVNRLVVVSIMRCFSWNEIINSSKLIPAKNRDVRNALGKVWTTPRGVLT